MLHRTLTIEEQSSILGELFGFEYLNTSDSPDKEHWVLYDAEGDEFYGYSKNDKWDFTTLLGIFDYVEFLAEELGYSKCQHDMKKTLGL